ncbi:MAG TPA: 4Fe-4S dicluster domain-containing protein [Gemmatimonadales bacterium]|nr:4Fe-4S dicluster domain-containing protein [Gemmatimonadales bacterium]
MAIDAGRRAALRSAFERLAEQVVQRTEERVIQKRYLRPPGALPEMAFLAACTRCGDCARACPVQAIVKVPPEGGLAAGTPFIDAAMQACVACPDMPCAAACPTDALTVPAAGWAGYRIGVLEFLPERCITYQNITCRACAEACPVGEAALVIDDAGHPVLRAEGCVGCGACLRACITSPPSFLLRPAAG